MDVDHHVDLVARQIGDLGVHAHRVLAAAEILIREVLLDLIEHRAVEGLALRQADVAQAFLQILGLDVLVALDLELGDRGPLDHHHEQRVAVAAQFHVAKEAGGVERAHGLADALLIEVITDVDRQIIEYGAFGYSLQPLDPNVADDESVLRGLRMQRRPQGLDGERHQANQPKFKPHARTACNLDGRRAHRSAAPAAQT